MSKKKVKKRINVKLHEIIVTGLEYGKRHHTKKQLCLSTTNGRIKKKKKKETETNAE